MAEEKAVPKTPIEVIETVIHVIHEVLDTREAFENHPGEVTAEERAEIAERIGLALTPGVEEVEEKKKPKK